MYTPLPISVTSSSAQTQIYDVRSDTWAYGPAHFKMGVFGCGAISASEGIIVGGSNFNLGAEIATAYRYDVAARTFTALTGTLAEPTSELACARTTAATPTGTPAVLCTGGKGSVHTVLLTRTYLYEAGTRELAARPEWDLPAMGADVAEVGKLHAVGARLWLSSATRTWEFLPWVALSATTASVWHPTTETLGYMNGVEVDLEFLHL